MLKFQSTHPHGVRLTNGLGDFKVVLVSIHAPTWGATVMVINDFLIGKFQSTHPHGVRLKNSFMDGSPLGVSIHAPTWGATFFVCSLSIAKLFQSTHPHGVRHEYPFVPQHSIVCFNPRTHMGCDLLIPRLKSTPVRFQSTHPHGVRQ